MKLILEKIKFSTFRNSYKNIKFEIKKLFSLIFNINFLWNNNFQNLLNPSKSTILIFAPSMTIDKPNYLNVGLRNLIEEAKKINIEVEILQCIEGLDICHLGGSPFKSSVHLPCKSCTKVNSLLYKDLNIIKFNNIEKSQRLNDLTFNDLKNFKYKNIEVGKNSITSIAWILRTSEIEEKHKDYLYKCVTSSIKLIDFLEKVDTDYFSGVLVFNGLTLPEAIMYEWCVLNNINIATFESGWSLNSQYALELNYGPTSQHFFNFEDRALNDSENDLINEYINNKRTGLGDVNFSDRRKIISIYGNVSWDTSQAVASTLFKSMYDWLDSLIPLIQENPEYIFVFRSHPGENRDLKQTWFGLEKWYKLNAAKISNNSLCYSADSNVDSYQLVEMSELVLVYNSTIGIESAILGKKVIAAAKTHYSDSGFVDFYSDVETYLYNLKKIISECDFQISPSSVSKARSYYYQLLNEVSYEFGDINLKLKFNEHTLVNDYKLNKFNIDRVDKLLKSFIKRKPLEKKFNL
tara:strand:- start:10287 stop:11849 length:1563 start_codon:yes stop_codon:yes gene_type:complete